MRWAHALLEIKSVDPVERIIEGIASTPDPDRGGDIMVPEGAQFTLPMPFKFEHGPAIGEVFAATVTPKGIAIKAQVSQLADDAPAELRALIDRAWHSMIAKPPLMRGLSIGWKGVKAEAAGRFTKYLEWIWAETSAVTIPMNANCTIALIKSLDTPLLLASEPSSIPPAPRRVVSYKTMPTEPKTYHEQITDLANKRAAHEARMGAIQEKASSEGRTKDDAEREEFATLRTEIGQMDEELKDLRDLELLNRSKAVPIVPVVPDVATRPTPVPTAPIRVKSLTPPGTAFTRMCIALAGSKGDSFQALQKAKTWADMPEVEVMVKAAVAAGTTTDATWAGPLAAVQPLVDEFLELLRPMTFLGRIPNLRQVPPNVSVPTQTGGGTYAWVGQGLAKPVTSAAFSTTAVPFSKAAGIIVLTDELVRHSSPAAEGVVRQEMLAGMAQFSDVQFIDPTVAAVANVNPASITNGAATAAASGATAAAAKADLAAAVAAFTAGNIPLSGSVWLMNDSNAFGLGISLNALGQPLFPSVGINGGTLFGMPVIVSNNVGNRVVLVHAPSILFADDGGITIDSSREASLQMDSAPDNPTSATTVMVSLWQRNMLGLKVERHMHWIRARTAAVYYISAAAYTGA